MDGWRWVARVVAVALKLIEKKSTKTQKSFPRVSGRTCATSDEGGGVQRKSASPISMDLVHQKSLGGVGGVGDAGGVGGVSGVSGRGRRTDCNLVGGFGWLGLLTIGQVWWSGRGGWRKCGREALELATTSEKTEVLSSPPPAVAATLPLALPPPIGGMKPEESEGQ